MKLNRKIGFNFSFIFILLITAGGATGATMPAYEELPAIALSTPPGQIAVSLEGKVYVVEGQQNRIGIYGKNGTELGGIYIENPESVGIGRSGEIYIGTKKDLSVKIYNAEGRQTGELGQGEKEFKLPKGITTDAEGNVYVVDALDNSVKVYTATGGYIRKIEDSGNLPEAAVVSGSELYVIDHPLLSGQNGESYRGARVQVFDLNGSAVRNFGSHGTDAGQFIMPAGIAADKDGRICVTDAYQGVALCYEGVTGQYLGAVHTPTNPMVTPIGAAVSGENCLIMASQHTQSIKIYGLEGYTYLSVNPGSLQYTAKEGMGDPESRSVTIGNAGTGELSYTATKTEEWIEIQAGGSEVIGPRGQVSMVVGVKSGNLAPGTYTGAVNIQANGSSEQINIKLEITQTAKLKITPDILNYSYKSGSEQPSGQAVKIEITDDPSGTTVWTAVSEKTWLTITPGSGSGAVTDAVVNVSPAGLQTGTYQGRIEVNAQGAMGSPAGIEVTVKIEALGSITVSTNVEEAKYSITGPVNANGSGKSWTLSNVPDGTYKINYENVAGYKTPQPEEQTVVNAGAIEFQGTYEDLRKAENILVSPGVSASGAAAVGIYRDGIKQKEIIPFEGTSKNGYNTAAGDINGDKEAEIIIGRGGQGKSPAQIAVYDKEGNLMAGTYITAMGSRNGAKVACGDLDGDGRAEIIVAAGPGEENAAEIKIYKYEDGGLRETGIDAVVFESKYGVNAACGDTDGDGRDELIVAPGPDPEAGAVVKVLKTDATGGTGNWKLTETGIEFTALTSKYGANIAAGDLNGDGTKEIIASSGSSRLMKENKIAVYDGGGRGIGVEITEEVSGGVEVASGDLDMDGKAEIISACGPKPANGSTIRIYKSDGSPSGSFEAYENSTYGAKISMGDWGL